VNTELDKRTVYSGRPTVVGPRFMLGIRKIDNACDIFGHNLKFLFLTIIYNILVEFTANTELWTQCTISRFYNL